MIRCCAVFWIFAAAVLSAGEPAFYRAVNLGGPALTIDGRPWEAGAGARDFSASGDTFESQNVVLKPQTDARRARMIRSSVWGSKPELTVRNVPAGPVQIFLYVWEDNNSEQFDLLVNGRVVEAKFRSGTAGMWKKLGPWMAQADGGVLTISANGPDHGAANLSGLELWTGDGPVPGAEGAAFVSDPSPDQVAFFESRVRPLLADHCYECHSAKAPKLKGGLLLDSRAGVQKGGDTGPVVAPGDPEASLLLHAVRHTSPDLTMPPDKKLAAEEITILTEWVRMGAPDPRSEDTVAAVRARGAIDWNKAREWWSFRPLVAPEVPPVQDAAWPGNEIDRFVLAKLETAGLSPAPDADKSILIRRATYDLTGLPPSPEEVSAFLADPAPDAFARVVERLLASPRYGERWGRHWLDVVRYADTAGDNSDFPIPQIRRYRDWVIDAFQQDLPYDQFVREQIAGDLQPEGTQAERDRRTIATGYLANARRFGSRVDDYPQHLTIEDTIDNVGRAFLGLTVNCARCHDHKFDPIPAADYYGLYGIFQSTRYPWPGIELDQKQRDLVPVPSAGDGQLAYAVAEGPQPGDAAIQLKGDPARPGPVVRRHFLTILGGGEVPPDRQESGRAQLAQWLTAPENPLTARVMANRIWLYHFGRGIVPTPNDFGKQGKPASHPELLDWLAARFRDGGWSVKSMHRLILLSRTWQMSSQREPAAVERDPANEWLAAFPRRRLDAESLRDTLLTLGGNLDLSPPGEHPFPPQSDWKFTQHHPFKAVYESNHRSVYLMTQRIQRHPYLAIFDGADPSTSSPARPTSTTPLQALYLLNDSFVHAQAGLLADRVSAGTNDAAARISALYQLTLCRPPEPEESAAALRYLSDARDHLIAAGKTPEESGTGAWHSFVRVLFRLNEFVYLD